MTSDRSAPSPGEPGAADRPDEGAVRFTDRGRSVAVRLDLLDRTTRYLLTAAPAVPVVAGAQALLVADHVAPAALVAWLVFGTGLSTILAGATVAYRRARAQGNRIRIAKYERSVVAGMAGMGCTLGAGALMVLLSGAPIELDLIAVMVALGASGASRALTAASWRFFVAMELPLVGLPVIGLVAGGTREHRVLAGLGAVYLALSVVYQREVHHAVTSAVEGQHERERLLDQLARERDRVHASNVRLQAVNAELRHRAHHDPLTGLVNRTGFHEMLAAALAGAPGRTGVLFCDLDRFKIVNDSFGHECGDHLLRAVASRALFRLEPGDELSRLAGDEFTVLCRNVRDDADLQARAEAILATFVEPFQIRGRALAVGASVGGALARPGDEPADVLREADLALYRAKERGRMRVELCDDTVRERLRRRIEDEHDLRTAIEREQICLWLQPIVDLATGATVAAEGLARWRHPTLGIRSATEFIGLADELGLAEGVNVFLYHQAVELRAAAGRAGLVGPGFRVAVNVAASLLHPWVLDGVLERCAARRLPPSALTFEVTEAGLSRDQRSAVEVLGRAREAGIRIELDDFGTGQSSLSLLRSMPLDGVKIDRSFVAGIVEERADRVVVGATITLARELGLDVTVEGVETAEQADVLRDLGVPRAQGWLFGPPFDPAAAWSHSIAASSPVGSGEGWALPKHLA